MSNKLRYNTQQVLPMPRLVQPDGITPATGLQSAMDNSSTGVRIRKNFGTWAARAATVVTTLDKGKGFYDVVLQAADVPLGILHVEFTNAGCAPFDRVYEVLTQEAYDTLVAGTDRFTVDLAGYPLVNVVGIADGAISAAATDATFVAEAQASAAAALAAFGGTGVAKQSDLALMKVNTDKMNWTGTNLQVDVQQLNGTDVIGDGSPGNKWRK